MRLTAAECLDGVEITEPRISPDGRWIAMVLSRDQGSFLYRIDLDEFRRSPDRQSISGAELYAGPAWSPWPVRAGRSLGGGCFSWLPNSSGIVVVSRSGDLWLVLLDGTSHLIVEATNDRPDAPGPMSSPVVDPTGRHVLVTVEQAQVYGIEISSGAAARIDGGDWDFVSDPVWWQGRPHWIAWNIPHMPWDISIIVNTEGEQFGPETSQVQQPQVAESGRTWGWLDDSTGWLNLFIDQEDQSLRVDEPNEHGGPSWGERQRSWCFNDRGTQAAFVRNEEGFGRLCSVDIASGRVVERGKAIHGQLSWARDTLVALRTGAKTPTRVVVYETRGDEWERRDVVIGPSGIASDHPSLVEPELIRARASDGEQLFARLYRSPITSRVSNDGLSRHRLLCWLHGGPTDQWTVSFMPRVVYWLDRGYDILVPDHRGSTGHGRRYTQSLRQLWGDLDVADVICIVERVLDDQPETDIAIMGSSAGGMTALAVLARKPAWMTAAVVAYPVSDIAALDHVTHRFEAHYNRSLMGSSDETRQRSLERSPIHHVGSIAATPLLIFHGTDDPVVPISQSDQLVEGLRNHGGDVEYVVFEGEGHGFRQGDNKIFEFERTEEFLERHLAR